jgi:hypothetical protein
MNGPETNFGWDDEECVSQEDKPDWLLLSVVVGIAVAALAWWLS